MICFNNNPTNKGNKMAKAINVKVARTKVIKALEVKVEEMKNQQMNFDLAYAKHESDYTDWKNKVAQIAYAHLDSVKDKQKTISVRNAWHNDDNIRVDVEVEIPKDKLPAEPEAPKNPFQSQGYGRNYIGGFEDRLAEIQNAIRVLSMSDEEVVSTSTYQSVSRYL
jgi:hypothetical protein